MCRDWACAVLPVAPAAGLKHLCCTLPACLLACACACAICLDQHASRERCQKRLSPRRLRVNPLRAGRTWPGWSTEAQRWTAQSRARAAAGRCTRRRPALPARLAARCPSCFSSPQVMALLRHRANRHHASSVTAVLLAHCDMHAAMRVDLVQPSLPAPPHPHHYHPPHRTPTGNAFHGSCLCAEAAELAPTVQRRRIRQLAERLAAVPEGSVTAPATPDAPAASVETLRQQLEEEVAGASWLAYATVAACVAGLCKLTGGRVCHAACSIMYNGGRSEI